MHCKSAGKNKLNILPSNYYIFSISNFSTLSHQISCFLPLFRCDFWILQENTNSTMYNFTIVLDFQIWTWFQGEGGGGFWAISHWFNKKFLPRDIGVMKNSFSIHILYFQKMKRNSICTSWWCCLLNFSSKVSKPNDWQINESSYRYMGKKALSRFNHTKQYTYPNAKKR